METEKFSSLESISNEIKNGKIYPWLYKNTNEIKGMIIDPDTDGFITSLFLNQIFGWKVVGFYDGKLLIITEDKFLTEKDKYFFVDVEILRPNIKSSGHHIITWDYKQIPSQIESIFSSCLQPNIWRGRDVKNTFEYKYPFGTFHLIVSIIYYLYQEHESLKIFYSEDKVKKVLSSFLYIDGTFKNLLNYPENCLNWLKYMTNDDKDHPLERVLNHPTSAKEIMKFMKDFFNTVNNIWNKEKIKSKGKFQSLKDVILQKDFEHYLKSEKADELLKYLEFLSSQYEWKFNPNSYPVLSKRLFVFEFKKNIIKTSKKNYNLVMSKNPVSLAITSKSRKGIEYSIDIKNVI